MYNICVIAYPTNSGLEEQINEFFSNGSNKKYASSALGSLPQLIRT